MDSIQTDSKVNGSSEPIVLVTKLEMDSPVAKKYLQDRQITATTNSNTKDIKRSGDKPESKPTDIIPNSEFETFFSNVMIKSEELAMEEEDYMDYSAEEPAKMPAEACTTTKELPLEVPILRLTRLEDTDLWPLQGHIHKKLKTEDYKIKTEPSKAPLCLHRGKSAKLEPAENTQLKTDEKKTVQEYIKTADCSISLNGAGDFQQQSVSEIEVNLTECIGNASDPPGSVECEVLLMSEPESSDEEAAPSARNGNSKEMMGYIIMKVPVKVNANAQPDWVGPAKSLLLNEMEMIVGKFFRGRAGVVPVAICADVKVECLADPAPSVSGLEDPFIVTDSASSVEGLEDAAVATWPTSKSERRDSTNSAHFTGILEDASITACPAVTSERGLSRDFGRSMDKTCLAVDLEREHFIEPTNSTDGLGDASIAACPAVESERGLSRGCGRSMDKTCPAVDLERENFIEPTNSTDGLRDASIAACPAVESERGVSRDACRSMDKTCPAVESESYLSRDSVHSLDKTCPAVESESDLSRDFVRSVDKTCAAVALEKEDFIDPAHSTDELEDAFIAVGTVESESDLSRDSVHSLDKTCPAVESESDLSRDSVDSMEKTCPAVDSESEFSRDSARSMDKTYPAVESENNPSRDFVRFLDKTCPAVELERDLSRTSVHSMDITCPADELEGDLSRASVCSMDLTCLPSLAVESESNVSRDSVRSLDKTCPGVELEIDPSRDFVRFDKTCPAVESESNLSRDSVRLDKNCPGVESESDLSRDSIRSLDKTFPAVELESDPSKDFVRLDKTCPAVESKGDLSRDSVRALHKNCPAVESESKLSRDSVRSVDKTYPVVESEREHFLDFTHSTDGLEDAFIPACPVVESESDLSRDSVCSMDKTCLAVESESDSFLDPTHSSDRSRDASIAACQGVKSEKEHLRDPAHIMEELDDSSIATCSAVRSGERLQNAALSINQLEDASTATCIKSESKHLPNSDPSTSGTCSKSESSASPKLASNEGVPINGEIWGLMETLGFVLEDINSEDDMEDFFSVLDEDGKPVEKPDIGSNSSPISEQPLEAVSPGSGLHAPSDQRMQDSSEEELSEFNHEPISVRTEHRSRSRLKSSRQSGKRKRRDSSNKREFKAANETVRNKGRKSELEKLLNGISEDERSHYLTRSKSRGRLVNSISEQQEFCRMTRSKSREKSLNSISEDKPHCISRSKSRGKPGISSIFDTEKPRYMTRSKSREKPVNISENQEPRPLSRSKSKEKALIGISEDVKPRRMARSKSRGKFVSGISEAEALCHMSRSKSREKPANIISENEQPRCMATSKPKEKPLNISKDQESRRLTRSKSREKLASGISETEEPRLLSRSKSKEKPWNSISEDAEPGKSREKSLNGISEDAEPRKSREKSLSGISEDEEPRKSMEKSLSGISEEESHMTRRQLRKRPSNSVSEDKTPRYLTRSRSRSRLEAQLSIAAEENAKKVRLSREDKEADVTYLLDDTDAKKRLFYKVYIDELCKKIELLPKRDVHTESSNSATLNEDFIVANNSPIELARGSKVAEIIRTQPGGCETTKLAVKEPRNLLKCHMCLYQTLTKRSLEAHKAIVHHGRVFKQNSGIEEIGKNISKAPGDHTDSHNKHTLIEMVNLLYAEAVKGTDNNSGMDEKQTNIKRPLLKQTGVDVIKESVKTLMATNAAYSLSQVIEKNVGEAFDNWTESSDAHNKHSITDMVRLLYSEAVKGTDKKSLEDSGLSKTNLFVQADPGMEVEQMNIRKPLVLKQTGINVIKETVKTLMETNSADDLSQKIRKNFGKVLGNHPQSLRTYGKHTITNAEAVKRTEGLPRTNLVNQAHPGMEEKWTKIRRRPLLLKRTRSEVKQSVKMLMKTNGADNLSQKMATSVEIDTTHLLYSETAKGAGEKPKSETNLVDQAKAGTSQQAPSSIQAEITEIEQQVVDLMKETIKRLVDITKNSKGTESGSSKSTTNKCSKCMERSAGDAAVPVRNWEAHDDSCPNKAHFKHLMQLRARKTSDQNLEYEGAYVAFLSSQSSNKPVYVITTKAVTSESTETKGNEVTGTGAIKFTNVLLDRKLMSEPRCVLKKLDLSPDLKPTKRKHAQSRNEAGEALDNKLIQQPVSVVKKTDLNHNQNIEANNNRAVSLVKSRDRLSVKKTKNTKYKVFSVKTEQNVKEQGMLHEIALKDNKKISPSPRKYIRLTVVGSETDSENVASIKDISNKTNATQMTVVQNFLTKNTNKSLHERQASAKNIFTINTPTENEPKANSQLALDQAASGSKEPTPQPVDTLKENGNSKKALYRQTSGPKSQDASWKQLLKYIQLDHAYATRVSTYKIRLPVIYRCPLCSFLAVKAQSLQKHMVTMHGEVFQNR